MVSAERRRRALTRGTAEQATLFDEWLENAPHVWLICKAGHHSFDDANSALRRDGPVYVEWVECKRGCGVERTREISARDGRLVGVPHYSYPDKYVTVGAGLLTADRRGALRLAHIQRRLTSGGGKRGRAA